MNTPQTGERYYHFKNPDKPYVIVCIGKDSETEEEKVVYKDLSDESKIWIRPLAMFLDMKELPDGTSVQRFTRID